MSWIKDQCTKGNCNSMCQPPKSKIKLKYLQRKTYHKPRNKVIQDLYNRNYKKKLLRGIKADLDKLTIILGSSQCCKNVNFIHVIL